MDRYLCLFLCYWWHTLCSISYGNAVSYSTWFREWIFCLVVPVLLLLISSVILFLFDWLLTMFDDDKVLLLQSTCSSLCLSVWYLDSLFWIDCISLSLSFSIADSVVFVVMVVKFWSIVFLLVVLVAFFLVGAMFLFIIVCMLLQGAQWRYGRSWCETVMKYHYQSCSKCFIC